MHEDGLFVRAVREALARWLSGFVCFNVGMV
jgi:hypothetical protein